MAKILNRFTSTIIYEDESPTIAETVQNAIKTGADLTGASLVWANLYGADLTRTNLTGADLTGANLARANLSEINLYGGRLSEANLCGVNLTGANLYRASLTGADLTGASLVWANLYRANLYRADLTGANLYGATLIGADLTGANLPAFSHCPEIGSFVAFKRLRHNLIAVIEIPAEARRTSSLVGRKCRAEYAEVLKIESKDGSAQFDSGISTNDRDFVYRVNEIARPDSYDDDIRVECTSGIHFFITRKEAVDYI